MVNNALLFLSAVLMSCVIVHVSIRNGISVLQQVVVVHVRKNSPGGTVCGRVSNTIDDSLKGKVTCVSSPLCQLSFWQINP